MAKGGKYLNPERAKKLEVIQDKTAQLNVALKAKKFKEAQKLSDEVEKLTAELDSGNGRSSILENVSPAEALKMKLEKNEAVVIVRTSKGSIVTKKACNPGVKFKRLGVNAETIWPEKKKGAKAKVS